MAYNILASCCWLKADFQPPPDSGAPSLPQVSLVQQRSGVDGTFLLAALLADHLQADRDNHVLLFATHHTTAHYVAACQKLTFNATSCIQSNRLRIIDLSAELYEQCATVGRTAPTPGDVGVSLFNLIEKCVNELPAKGNFLVILDDLGFFSIAVPAAGETGVINFAEQLVGKGYPGVSRVVLKVNAAECYGRLCAVLADLAFVNVVLEPLPSGNFREVDGRLTVQKAHRADGSCLVLRKQHANLLYKVGDRQIRTFLPGEFGIKNL